MATDPLPAGDDPARLPAPPAIARPLSAMTDADDDDRPRRRPRYPDRRPGRAAGVLPRAYVRMACFVVITLSLLAAGAMCVMAVWDAAPHDVAWKSVATLAIVAVVMIGFTVLNEAFGPKDDG